MKTKRTFTFSGLGSLMAVFFLSFFMASEAEASHFRFGHVTWTVKSGNTAEFVLTAAFRRSGYSGTYSDGRPAVGDIITEYIGGTGLSFGDGSSTGTLKFKVIAIDIAQDVLIGRALQPGSNTNEFIPHTYSAPLNNGSPWLAQLSGCCRIGALQNYNGGYHVQTEVRFDITNNSPVSSLPTIVNVPINTIHSFFVPGADADGDALSFRFATGAESSIYNLIGPVGGSDATHAPTINSTTGQVTWNTNGGTAIGNLFTMQVVIEESRNGNVIGRSAIDFILKIVAFQGTAPTCALSPPGPHNVNAGSNLTFTLTGNDPDNGDVLTLNTGGLPTGATMTPGLPHSGATGVNSTFNWTPTVGQAGPHVVTFNVTDQTGLQDVCSVNITVANCPDADNDGVCDADDNCPNDANPNQEDADNDGIGDVCDDCPNDPDNDADNDGICGDVDNCPNNANPNQEDLDNDGIGDACDPCNKYVLFAEEDLEIEETIVHKGGVGVSDDGGEAKIDDESIVTAVGTWVQADEIEVKDDSEVAVEIEEPAEDDCLPAFCYNPHDTDEDVCVEEDETVTITGWNYDDVEVEEGGTLIIDGPNEIFFESFDADDEATIIFKQCTDVKIEYEFELGKESDFNPTNENVRVFAESEILFKGRNTVYGLFYSLTEDIKIKRGKSYDRNKFHGQFIAEDIKVEKYTDLYCVEYEPCPPPPVYPEFDGEDDIAPEEILTLEEEEPKVTEPSPFEEVEKATYTPEMKVAPNPFRTATRVSFKLEQSDQILIEVYNLNGQRVDQLYSGMMDSGNHEIRWDGNSQGGNALENGLYFIVLKSNEQVITKKVSLQR